MRYIFQKQKRKWSPRYLICMLEVCLGHQGSWKFEFVLKVIVDSQITKEWKGTQTWITQNYGSRGYCWDDEAGTTPDLIFESSSRSPTVGVILILSFLHKDLQKSCLPSMLTKLTEEETYGETPVNECFCASLWLHPDQLKCQLLPPKILIFWKSKDPPIC